MARERSHGSVELLWRDCVRVASLRNRKINSRVSESFSLRDRHRFEIAEYMRDTDKFSHNLYGVWERRERERSFWHNKVYRTENFSPNIVYEREETFLAQYSIWDSDLSFLLQYRIFGSGLSKFSEETNFHIIPWRDKQESFGNG